MEIILENSINSSKQSQPNQIRCKSKIYSIPCEYRLPFACSKSGENVSAQSLDVVLALFRFDNYAKTCVQPLNCGFAINTFHQMFIR